MGKDNTTADPSAGMDEWMVKVGGIGGRRGGASALKADNYPPPPVKNAAIS